MTDAQHNVTAMVAENGQVVERYAYDPYGRVLVLNGENDPDGAEYTPDADGLSDVGNVILYAGYRFDAAAGLYHVRHRYHHPTLGRWINRDPKGYVDGMNLYQYTASRPMAATDPMGTDMIMPEAPGSNTGGDMGDLSVLDSDGKKTPASEMELKADPTGAILEGVDTALLEIGIYVEAPKENGFDLRSLLAMADPADYIPASGDKGWLVEDRLSTSPFTKAGKWAHDFNPDGPRIQRRIPLGANWYEWANVGSGYDGKAAFVRMHDWYNRLRIGYTGTDCLRLSGQILRDVREQSEVQKYIRYVDRRLKNDARLMMSISKGAQRTFEDRGSRQVCADIASLHVRLSLQRFTVYWEAQCTFGPARERQVIEASGESKIVAVAEYKCHIQYAIYDKYDFLWWQPLGSVGTPYLVFGFWEATANGIVEGSVEK